MGVGGVWVGGLVGVVFGGDEASRQVGTSLLPKYISHCTINFPYELSIPTSPIECTHLALPYITVLNMYTGNM